jgi:hypothetical protein
MCMYIYSALVLVSDAHSWNPYIVVRCSLLFSDCLNIYIFAALYTWNIQFVAASDVCHCDYSLLLRVFCFSNFMFYGPEQLDCFQDAHVEISTLGFFYTELFHEFVTFVYTIVITLCCFLFINLNIYGSDVYMVHIYINSALVLVLGKMHVYVG